MISLTVTGDQFECIKKLAFEPNAAFTAHQFILTYSNEEKTKGHIHSVEVEADFEYQEEVGYLIFKNEVKHGMYKFVSDKTIGQHLQDLIGNLKCEDEESTYIHQPEVNATTTVVTETEPSTIVETPEPNSAPPSGLEGFVKAPIINQS